MSSKTLDELEREFLIKVIYPAHRAHLAKRGYMLPESYEHLPSEYIDLLVNEAQAAIRYFKANRNLFTE